MLCGAIYMFGYWLTGLLFVLYVCWTAASRVAVKELERIDFLFGQYADKDAEGIIGLVIARLLIHCDATFLKYCSLGNCFKWL